jgi:beta propeller domain-containing protein
MMSVLHEAALRSGATTGLRAGEVESPLEGERSSRLGRPDQPVLAPATSDRQLLKALRDGQRLISSPAVNRVLEHRSGRLPASSHSAARTNAIAPERWRLSIGQSRTAHEVVDIELFELCPEESRRWCLHIDGFLRASRTLDDTLILVTSYRPHLAGLTRPAMGTTHTTTAPRQADERLIGSACLSELLPRYWGDAGAAHLLVTTHDWLVDASRTGYEAYTDLVVITAICLTTGCITDVKCLSGQVNGLHLSDDSLHVGAGARGDEGAQATLVHRFALDRGRIIYRVSGRVAGEPVWGERDCFMDEYRDQLRMITTERTADGRNIHRLSVLSETADGRLVLFAAVTNTPQAAPLRHSQEHTPRHCLGSSHSTVRAVRFAGERIYVVTGHAPINLHLIDHRNPADPHIVSSLELPAVATDLRTIGPPEAQLLLAIGRQSHADGDMVLIDVCDMSAPRRLSWDAPAARGRADMACPITAAHVPGAGIRRVERFSVPMTPR